jgi:hypothetical protein
VNDPTTAVQALDRMESLLRVLAIRDLSMQNIADSSGTIRVKLVLPAWDQCLAVPSMRSSSSQPCCRASHTGSPGCSATLPPLRHPAAGPNSKSATQITLPA